MPEADIKPVDTLPTLEELKAAELPEAELKVRREEERERGASIDQSTRGTRL
jgi:hypothetical protein